MLNQKDGTIINCLWLNDSCMNLLDIGFHDNNLSVGIAFFNLNLNVLLLLLRNPFTPPPPLVLHQSVTAESFSRYI